jgi:phosphatidylglycerophosphate synthase
VRTVRPGPVLGMIAQVALLALLNAAVGLDPAAWATGVAYGLVTNVTLARALERSGSTALMHANRVTLTRATLVGGVAALTAGSFGHPVPVATLVWLTVPALLLDGVDGWVARRTGTVSALGARFDMEVDAFLILVLCVYLVRDLGGWVLVIGAMRYAFVAAGWLLPWMRASLPPRFWRKVVAAVQGIMLAVAAADLLPRWAAQAVVGAALALLVESFGHDIWWLWRHRHPATAAHPAPVQAAERDAERVTVPGGVRDAVRQPTG